MERLRELGRRLDNIVTLVVEGFFFKRVASLTDEEIQVWYESDRQHTLQRRQEAKELLDLLGKREACQDHPA